MIDHGLTPIEAPPASLREEYRVAARVIDELTAREVILHLEVDDEANRVRVLVQDGDGRLIGEVPPGRLLDMLSGGDRAGHSAVRR